MTGIKELEERSVSADLEVERLRTEVNKYIDLSDETRKAWNRALAEQSEAFWHLSLARSSEFFVLARTREVEARRAKLLAESRLDEARSLWHEAEETLEGARHSLAQSAEKCALVQISTDEQ